MLSFFFFFFLTYLVSDFYVCMSYFLLNLVLNLLMVTKRVKWLLAQFIVGQSVAFVGSLNGLWTTKLVDSNASYPLLQTLTAYAFIFFVYAPLFFFFYFRNRHRRFSNFSFLHCPWKYAILGLVDMEANFCVFKAFQYTDMVSVQLLMSLTIPSVLILSFFFLKMRFALTHIIGCLIAIGGSALMIVLDADGVTRSVMGPDVVKGNLLCVLSATLYGLSNVLSEWFIKPQLKQESASGDLVNQQEAKDEPKVDDRPLVDSVRQGLACHTAEEAAFVPEQVESLPVVSVYIPLVENLCCMSGCALVFCIIQFFAVEWSTFSPQRASWTGRDWLYQMMFGLSMFFFYTGLQVLFLISSAAFANVSLLATTVYNIIWNVSVFNIYPKPLFFVAYVIIIAGAIMYNLSDIHWKWCPRVNYICGEPRLVVAAVEKAPQPVSHDT